MFFLEVTSLHLRSDETRGMSEATMLARQHKDENLQALNLLVGMYLQLFKIIFYICTCNIDI